MLLASALFQMTSANEIDDPELRGLPWWAWDALDLAANRYIAETPAQVIERMRDILERASVTAARCGGTWTKAWAARPTSRCI
jgi:hypothetical protein